MKRRSFLKNTGMGVVLPSLIGGFGIKAMANTSMYNAVVNPYVETDHVLVLIQLNGGNDGLNMVIPLDQYDKLQAARANIIVPESSVLSLNGYSNTGLHPKMTGIRSLFNEGRVKIIQGVGYDNQDFSHFRSTDIWQSASNANEVFTTGWLGRYLQYEYPNYPEGYPNEVMPDPLAIQLGSTMSLNFFGNSGAMGVAVNSGDGFYNLVNGVDEPVENLPWGDELTYIRLIARQAEKYTQVISQAYNNATNLNTNYPANTLADQLKIVARLIAGGLKTRIYHVTLNEFDTHSDQVNDGDTANGFHADLLSNLSQSVKAFVDDLDLMNLSDRVIGMTYSEFGRRVKSNASLGTDHGAAAPMLLFGNAIEGGILGANYQVPTVVTEDTNVDVQFDFRSMYASLLKDWFCVPEADVPDVMLHEHNYVNAIEAGTACISTSTHELNQNAGINLINNYPNPFSNSTTIEFTAAGGYCLLEIYDVQGHLLETICNRVYPEGKHSIQYDGIQLPSGNYFCRFVNKLKQQMHLITKI